MCGLLASLDRLATECFIANCQSSLLSYQLATLLVPLFITLMEESYRKLGVGDKQVNQRLHRFTAVFKCTIRVRLL